MNSILRKRGLRPARGNMLVLCVGIGLLILVLVGLAFWFQLIFFSNQLLQDSSEKVALRAAQMLNENNNAGKLNDMIGNSRELVFTSRQMLNKTESDANFADYKKFAADVMQRSREGAQLVADEKQRYINTSMSDLRKFAKEQTAPFGREVALFDAAVDKPKMVQFSVGALDNMDSSVLGSNVDALNQYDSTNRLLKHGKDFDFYIANNPLRLPVPDDDLNFSLSALPMAVNGTAAPLRLVSESHYKPNMVLVENGKDAIGSCSIMPSCTQVLMSVKMKSKVADHLESGTKTLSTACTNGSAPER